jgi:hypothetical protein
MHPAMASYLMNCENTVADIREKVAAKFFIA